METGRRFVSFWLLLVTACMSGCCGCGACGECDDGCNFHLDLFDCDSGQCGSFGRYDAGVLDTGIGPLGIVRGLAGPTALVADGVELFYVDRGVLVRVENDGESPVTLAMGVGNVGNLATDGVDVYWVGTFGDEPNDAGADADADVDADADAGSPAKAAAAGVFRVAVTGGGVERIATLDPLPTIETAGAFLVLRARTDDAGGSALGMLDEDDGGFAALASLSGNTENVHAFAIGPTGVVALDADGIVRVTDGGKSLLATGATGSALLATASGVVAVTLAETSFRVIRVDGEGGIVGSGGLATAVTSAGDRVFVAERETASIRVFGPSGAVGSPIPTSAVASGPTLLAADDSWVYWVAGDTIFRSANP